MEFNETLRRTVSGRWRVLVLFIVLPMLVVGALGLSNPTLYVSKARVQASATLPTTDVQANAMLSRVRAVVTSGSVIRPALKDSKVADRTQAQVAREIKVSRLGGSAVFNVRVTDRDPRTAEKLGSAVSEELVHFFNNTGNLLVTQLTDRESKLQDQRTQIAAQLPDARTASESGQLTAKLGSLDQQILDVQASLRAAQAAGLGDRTASLLSSASDAERVPQLSGSTMVLAGVIGLVAGLVAVTLLEVFRPHVAGPGAFARELDTPVLGRLPGTRRRSQEGDKRSRIDDETVLALRRAAARAGAGTVVLTGPGGEEHLARLAVELRTRLAGSGDSAAPGDTEPFAPGPDGPYGVGPKPDENGGRDRPAQLQTLAPGFGIASLADRRVAQETAVRESTVPTVQVAALHQLDTAHHPAPHVLVAVEPELPAYAELDRVKNLAATTAWPVIGVLGDPAHPRSGEESRFERPASIARLARARKEAG
ncbi:hypothetical protein ACIBW9_17840 [Streptomyces sp. NPDC049541]|uniref:hypothetical protein n=1 Tax=Streptomyces sp. NPDC049541 TaxID=3365594 RepID=UPI003799874D